MHIAWINIENLPPLGDVDLGCDERVNLFIGPNASGKTTILRAMSAADSGEAEPNINWQEEEDGTYVLYDAVFELDRGRIFLGLSDDWPQVYDSYPGPDLDVPLPFLYIPATRVNLPIMHLSDQTINHRGDVPPSDDPMRALFDIDSGVFYSGYVELAIDLLRKRMGSDRFQQRQLRRALEAGYSCAKSICPEIIHDNVPHPYVEESRGKKGLDIVHYGMGIGTTDNILGEPLYAGALSSGTQVTLLWIYALALKMAMHYDWSDGWESKPAILLIDEIENHLHPTWQRRVIPALLEHFPGCRYSPQPTRPSWWPV